MILSVKLDGSYRWQCDDCGAERNEYPHRGPRNSLCKRCQNIRYRAGRSPARIAFERMGTARRNRAYRQRRREGGWGGVVKSPRRAERWLPRR